MACCVFGGCVFWTTATRGTWGLQSCAQYLKIQLTLSIADPAITDGFRRSGQYLSDGSPRNVICFRVVSLCNGQKNTISVTSCSESHLYVHTLARLQCLPPPLVPVLLHQTVLRNVPA